MTLRGYLVRIVVPLLMSGFVVACGGKTLGENGVEPGDDSGVATDSGIGTGATDSGTGTGTGGELGPWASTSAYPLATNRCAGAAPYLYCAQQTCVASLGYVYCIGGASASTYYSQLSSAGLGSWIPAADYPEPVEEESCVVSSNYIYCVGGRVYGADGGAAGATGDVYYAPLLSPGIGTWTASTPFPYAALAPTCMTDSGYIYCVSGSPDLQTPQAYYAPISSSGVGAWAPTAAPPAATEGCSSIGGYAYCFGGASCCLAGPGDCYSPSYFAPLAATGIGAWKTTTELPTSVSAEYATAGSYIYYLSIPVFYASVSADGIGPWQTTTNYPDSLYPSTCVSSDAYLYCANPAASGSYFAQIGVPNPQALQLENPPAFPRSDYLVPACSNGGSASVSTGGVTVGAPIFDNNIDEAVVFNCASQASTSAGCTTTVASPNAASTCNYELTVWYPCTSPGPADTNCCFLPALGYPTPFDSWCISVGSNSFIIADRITMQQSQSPCKGGPNGLPP